MEDKPPAATAMPLHEYVAEEIGVWLVRRKMSRAELARRLGHPNQMQLSRRLNGQTPWDTDELAAIAKLLRVRTQDLLPKEPATTPAHAKPLDLNQLQSLSARLNMPLADLLPERPGVSSPWYVRLAQTPDHPIGRPPDNRPTSGPPVHEVHRRPQRRTALLPAAHMQVNAERLQS
jgi:transcriptional regulator with XRE-family HTH domain